MGLPKVSVVLVNFRGIDDTLNAIKSIQESNYPKELTEIIIVDNASGDNSIEALKKLGNQIVLVESNENLGFAGGVNLGVSKSNGEIIATVRIAKSGEWSSITRVYVNADYRGKGLGKLIVSAALKASHEQGATKAVLQVEAANATAISLYESLGFNFHHDYVYLEVK